ncbi:MAG: hypothetical protein CFE25_01130 [Chitinophagaceae bacterium BSSC1]|nr:MAG: hypothetical protein CFE25_01130 [Chitinophagaceae bacterium BSSC1]
MNQITLFRILSFILLPIALFFIVMDFIAIIMALGNPSLLFPVFLLTGMIIYVLSSFYFLLMGLNRKQVLGASVKDWIKVNAYVTLFLGFQFMLISVSIFYMGSASLQEFADKALAAQPNMPSQMNSGLFLKMLKGMAYFFFFLSLSLLVHISICFKLLKEYAHLFLPKEA